jgi:hypothetical protein
VHQRAAGGGSGAAAGLGGVPGAGVGRGAGGVPGAEAGRQAATPEPGPEAGA